MMHLNSSTNNATPLVRQRVVAAGKFFRLGAEKVMLNGVSYGPFKPNARGEPFPEVSQLAKDFASIRAMGFNTVRLYELPTDAVLHEAEAAGLWLMVGIPWAEHVDFLSEARTRQTIEKQVRDAAHRFGGNPSVVALIVGNEIEKTLVRWLGPERVKAFIERLIGVAKTAAPEAMVSYATYPSTEYLLPNNADFLAVNVYLENCATFAAYTLRLQHLAGSKPLVIAEFGMDVQQHGEAVQAEVFQWQHAVCEQLGVAGNVWFSFTDEWHRAGQEVTEWSFGIVDAARQKRAVCPSPQVTTQAPSDLRFSVIVCTRNGAATLKECLEALSRQSYSNCEVIVVDDGSTDAVPQIAQAFDLVRYHRQEPAGLSVARNTGASLATGEVLAYTDDDCIPDEDWLSYLAPAFADSQWVAAGGPNLPPTPRNATERCVALAPGGPAHVLLNDEEAEHLPGCNLAIRKASLAAIGGFRAEFTTAGDDVDVCWRLREAGGKLRFLPAAMVWHHRRFTVAAYFRQQRGYGTAEALLMKTHPQRFGPLGGARWRGAIYGDTAVTPSPREGSIYHGPLGYGAFQVIYAAGQGYGAWQWFAGILWIAFSLLFLALRLPLASVGIVTLAIVFAARRAWLLRYEASDANLHLSLLFWLCLWQPVVREWARARGMWRLGARPSFEPSLPDIVPPSKPRKYSLELRKFAFWSDEGKGREQWLEALRGVLNERGIAYREDDGWRWFDIECEPDEAASPAFVSVTEYHANQGRLTRVRLLMRVGFVFPSRFNIGTFLLRHLIPMIVGYEVCWRLFDWYGWLGPVVLLFAWILFEGSLLLAWSTWRYGQHLQEAARRAGLQSLKG